MWPKNNALFWKEKILGNAQRDRENIKNLEYMGWKVITLWECQIKRKMSRGEVLLNLVHMITTDQLSPCPTEFGLINN